MDSPNVEVTGAARLYRAASVWTAGLGHGKINDKVECLIHPNFLTRAPDGLSLPVLQRKANDCAHDYEYGLHDDKVLGRESPVKKRSGADANKATNYRAGVGQQFEETQVALPEKWETISFGNVQALPKVGAGATAVRGKMGVVRLSM